VHLRQKKCGDCTTIACVWKFSRTPMDTQEEEQEIDRKKAKKDAKRKEREDNLKSQELPEYEKYNVKKKDDDYQNKQKRHEEQQKRKQEQDEEKKKKQKVLEAEADGKARHSKPADAKPPFKFYADEHPDLESEKIKASWGELPEDDKLKYKEKAKKDKERYKQEMEEYNQTQEVLKAQKGGKKERRNQ